MDKLTDNKIDLDDTDHKILEILHKDARISMTALGKQVHLTSQAVKNRLDRLTDLGIVHYYTVNVNCPAYGYKKHALIYVTVHAHYMEKLANFLSESNYRIVHCYQITGAQAVFIDSYFADDDELDEFLKVIQNYGTYEIQLVIKDFFYL